MEVTVGVVGTFSDNNNIQDSEEILGQMRQGLEKVDHTSTISPLLREVVDRHDGHNR